ncbi:hypothetical protein SS50377_22459 [Spironucleus salmonicida]|uniref:Uncharacterized protein n=1 Tax=Spironucleus salmonicida TaxID=348837 RepID=V6LC19_9EUKA|nr:hypothetical protein SS50377_22459 [Spironucleus salmonicida]|eukprot:EST42050.1 Hypothetical protein SS50377_18357 [Spironucleus salmonicida]
MTLELSLGASLSLRHFSPQPVSKQLQTKPLSPAFEKIQRVSEEIEYQTPLQILKNAQDEQEILKSKIEANTTEIDSLKATSKQKFWLQNESLKLKNEETISTLQDEIQQLKLFNQNEKSILNQIQQQIIIFTQILTQFTCEIGNKKQQIRNKKQIISHFKEDLMEYDNQPVQVEEGLKVLIKMNGVKKQMQANENQ